MTRWSHKSANLLTRYHREAVANLLIFSKPQILSRPFIKSEV
jgi:hypothetical protein